MIVKLVAFGHKKRVGKDTAARFLMTYIRTTRKDSNIQKRGFADKLKQICFELYAWAGLKDAQYYEDNPKVREELLPALGKTPRQIWIEVGMAIRSVYGPTWVDYVMHTFKSNILIISDCRFPDEAERIHSHGGYVVRIDNPRVPHTSDVADDPLLTYGKWDYVIVNDGDLNDFFGKIVAFTEKYLV